MHMSAITVAVAGASGYAGGELLRLLLGHPARRDRRADGRVATPASALGALQPHLRRWPTGCWPRPRSRRSPATTSCSSALPHGQSGGDRRGRCRDDTRRRSTAAPTSGSRDPAAVGSVLRRRARRHLALRPARAARRSATLLARRAADRRARLLPDRLDARARARRVAAGLVEPDVVVVAASGTSGAGKAAKPHLLGSEVMGNAIGVRRRRHPPAHARDRPEPRRRSPTAPVHGQLHAAARADGARHPRDLLGAACTPGVDRRPRSARPT